MFTLSFSFYLYFVFFFMKDNILEIFTYCINLTKKKFICVNKIKNKNAMYSRKVYVFNIKSLIEF